MSDAPLAQYSFRRSVLEQERTYSLYTDRLVVEGSDIPPQVHPLAEVQTVHLKFERTRQRAYYQCFIHTLRGRISLRHVHYVGFAEFENRRETYTPFVIALCAELARYPGVQFKSGSLANFIAAIIAVAGMVVFALFALSTRRIGTAVFAVLFGLFFLKLMRVSRPRRFYPWAPPQHLLP